MNSRLRLTLAASALALVLGAGSSALAGPAWEFTSPGNDYSNGTWDFATAFTVSSDVTASGLGYYASPTNGQVNSNPVALYQCADDPDCFGDRNEHPCPEWTFPLCHHRARHFAGRRWL